MPTAQTIDTIDPDFASAAFYNLHFQCLSDRNMCNRKIANVQHVARNYDVARFSELHASSAIAQEVFFSHVCGIRSLSHCNGRFPGMAISVSERLMATLGTEGKEDLQNHHAVLIEGAAHAFFYDVGARLYLNVYVHSHSRATRARRARELIRAIRAFCSKSA